MNRVFILGAGFSYYLSGGQFPMMELLGENIKNKFDWISQYCNEKHYKRFDLERLLTDLELDYATKHISDILDFLREQFDLRKIDDSKKSKAENICSKLFKENDSIMTFNYDCLLEHILWIIKYWSPNGGYGEEISVFPLDRIKNPCNIILLKLHGSINFNIEKTHPNGNAKYSEPYISDEIFPGTHAIIGDKPNSNIEKSSIVLPSYIKLFGSDRSSIRIWHEAIEKIKKADTLIIIGYSFPKADILTRFLLSFLESKSNKKIKIIILNTKKEKERIKQQIWELGQFGYDVEWNMDLDITDADYCELVNVLKNHQYN